MKPKCNKCHKTIDEVKSLHRVNEKGISPAVWECDECFSGKIPEVVKAITNQ